MRGFHKMLSPTLVATCWFFLILNCAADNPETADAVLDRPLSAYTIGSMVGAQGLKVTSFQSAITALEKISGKKVILPAGISDWLKTHPNETGEIFGLTKGMKARELFEMVCLSFGFVWHYDPPQDAIILNFAWERNDPRSSTELVDVVADQKPLPWTTLEGDPKPNGVGGHDLLPDNWRIAFDALLCKPENFPAAVTVRLFHDNYGRRLFTLPIRPLFTGRMQDEEGRHLVLILISPQPLTNKDAPGGVAYYLFNPAGKFIRGGCYSMGDRYQGCVVSAKADKPAQVTIDVGWGSFAMNPTHVHFQLIDDDLVLSGSTSHDGKETSVADTQSSVPMAGYGTGLLKYTVAGNP